MMACYIIAGNTETYINPRNKWKLLFDLEINRVFTSPFQKEKKKKQTISLLAQIVSHFTSTMDCLLPGHFY